jgi:hypothetical protein
VDAVQSWRFSCGLCRKALTSPQLIQRALYRRVRSADVLRDAGVAEVMNNN